MTIFEMISRNQYKRKQPKYFKTKRTISQQKSNHAIFYYYHPVFFLLESVQLVATYLLA